MQEKLEKIINKNMFLSCFFFSTLILLIKIYLIPDTLEFIEPISIYTSLLSSVIFIYGFMIAPAVGEFKESERLRTELKSTIENIIGDVDYFSKLKPNIASKKFFKDFSHILQLVFARIADNKNSGNVHENINNLNDFLLSSETAGIPANHIIKLKQELSNFRKITSRLFFIKDNDSLPTVVHKLKNFITLFIIGTLLFVNIGDNIQDTIFIEIKEGIVIFILSFIYIYLSSIINSLEDPFDKRNFAGYIDIGFLRDYSKKI